MEEFINFVSNFSGPEAYALIFAVLLACGLGVPIPEDITLFAAGYLAYEGAGNLWGMILVSFAGVMVGDSLIFFLGARYGQRLTRYWMFSRLLPPDRLEAVREKFRQKGLKLLFAARFMPGLRAPIFFSAGTFHIPYRKLLLYDGGAALISVPAIVAAVYYFGDELDRVVKIIKRVEGGILGVIVIVILLIAAKWYITRRKVKSRQPSQ